VRSELPWVAVALCAAGCGRCPSVPFGGHAYWIAPSAAVWVAPVTARWAAERGRDRNGPSAACAEACGGAAASCELVEVAPASVQRETLRRAHCRYEGPDGPGEFWRLFDPSAEGPPTTAAGCAAVCGTTTWTTPVRCEVAEPVVATDGGRAVLCQREVAGRCFSPGSAQ
jgi:hypothetical protein